MDNEAVWLQVQDNVRGGITSAMEARLSALPGGGRALRQKQYVESWKPRLKKVGSGVCLTKGVLAERRQIHEEMFRLARAQIASERARLRELTSLV